MMLSEQVYTQAVLLSGGIDSALDPLLHLFCDSSIASVTNRLRDGLSPEDCKADFVAACALFALAALADVDDVQQMESIQVGDVTLRKKSRDTAANCLRMQAELMMAPYLRGQFTFLGV